jgi:hypothetical protein
MTRPLDGQHQANIRASDIAQRREPSIQARMQKLCREVRQIGHRRLRNADDVQPRRINMNMGIDRRSRRLPHQRLRGALISR